MKRILIIGKNSYIGKNFKKYLEVSPDKEILVIADAVSGESGEWKDTDFTGYDAVVMCSALVHKKEKKLGWQAYYDANTALPLAIAQKAKEQKVKQFIFLSSLAVYGREHELIEKGTLPQPETYYGRSKLEAEEGLAEIASPAFAVTIVRPPMVYGRKAKGSYQALRKFTRRFPFFPRIENRKSIISIRQLCRFLQESVITGEGGIYHPQDREYCSTSLLAQRAGKDAGRTVTLFPFPRWLSRALSKHWKYWKKSFGDLVVDKKIDSAE